MYEAHFNFSDRPFSTRPDPSFMYVGESHSLAMAALQYGVTQSAGFTVLTGEIGCGKTTLVEYFLERSLGAESYGCLNHTHESMGPLLPWIVAAFGADAEPTTPIESHRMFQSYLRTRATARERVVLVVDEAQNLTVGALEELRVISNMMASLHPAWQIILVGQPELRETLLMPALRPLVQRTMIDFHIEPFRFADTSAYVAHRLKTVGGDPALFDDSALELIHRAADGIPRLVNLLCDSALVYAFGVGIPQITKAVVEDVVDDRNRLGLIGAMLAGEAPAAPSAAENSTLSLAVPHSEPANGPRPMRIHASP